MDVPFCVRVRYQGEIKCIILKSNGINSESFTEAVISAFKIGINNDLDPPLVLTDNLKMRIPNDQFEAILKTFHKGSNFFVNVELQPSNIKGAITMVTPMDILVGNGGLFCNRLKYLASKRKRLLKASVIGDDVAVAANNSNLILPNNIQEDLEFLKYSTIKDLDDDTIKQKLNNTRNSRLDIMKDNQSDLREKFPFFFSHPRLLLIDFAEKHGCMMRNAFLNLWPAVSERLRAMNFKDLVYSCFDMYKYNIKTPFIVAYGLSPEEIHRYYIKLEEHLISLPNECNVPEVFDFFIKLHDIFNIKFDDNLYNMMNFIEVFIYNNKNGRKNPTAHMKQVFKQLDL